MVWLTQSTVTHPKGVGIKFSLETKLQRRALRQVNARLRKIASLYRRSRYLMSQDEFLKRLDELENRGMQDSASASAAKRERFRREQGRVARSLIGSQRNRNTSGTFCLRHSLVRWTHTVNAALPRITFSLVVLAPW